MRPPSGHDDVWLLLVLAALSLASLPVAAWITWLVWRMTR